MRHLARRRLIMTDDNDDDDDVPENVTEHAGAKEI